ncbi:hypothetical protein LIER_26609 [Lithospermum erythrorhizon]|uniref:Uncharacterized protein n=1 Tax=Lithospermum erythrorhizon TaxID=34254 RepID=A0AAV3R8Z1_LITER
MPMQPIHLCTDRRSVPIHSLIPSFDLFIILGSHCCVNLRGGTDRRWRVLFVHVRTGQSRAERETCSGAVGRGLLYKESGGGVLFYSKLRGVG